jgi:hypothetical protein
MLLLKAVCPAALADDIVKLLGETLGTGRISHSRGTEAEHALDIVETEIPDAIVDRLIASFAELDGWDAGDVTLTTVGEGERFHSSGTDRRSLLATWKGVSAHNRFA